MLKHASMVGVVLEALVCEDVFGEHVVSIIFAVYPGL
jgi:hypothetical protein